MGAEQGGEKVPEEVFALRCFFVFFSLSPSLARLWGPPPQPALECVLPLKYVKKQNKKERTDEMKNNTFFFTRGEKHKEPEQTVSCFCFLFSPGKKKTSTAFSTQRVRAVKVEAYRL